MNKIKNMTTTTAKNLKKDIDNMLAKIKKENLNVVMYDLNEAFNMYFWLIFNIFKGG
jgi:uncharacterized iron-regulated protein